MLFYIGKYTGIDFIIFTVAYVLVVVLSLSLHEFAHAFVAYKSGDATPKMQGRVSINPLRHIDPIGIICCAFFGFGWAKPVQINKGNFRNIKKGTAWTSAAGIIMNISLSFISYGIFSLLALFATYNYLYIFVQQFFYFMFLMSFCSFSKFSIKCNSTGESSYMVR